MPVQSELTAFKIQFDKFWKSDRVDDLFWVESTDPIQFFKTMIRG